MGCEPHLVRTGQGSLLDAPQLAELRRQARGLCVHEDLSAFADFLVAREHRNARPARCKIADEPDALELA